MEVFDKDSIRLPTRIMMVGMTESGKTHYAMWLLYWLSDEITQLYIISSTMKPGEYNHMTTSAHIFNKYSPNIISDIIATQQLRQDSGEPLPQVAIFIDDSIHEIAKNDEVMTSVFTRGRHLNITVILVTQKFKAISNVIRDNTNYIICARVGTQMEKDALYKECGSNEKRTDFFEMLTSCTKNHGVCVITTTADGSSSMYKIDKAPSKIPRFYIEEPDAAHHPGAHPTNPTK